MGMIPSQEGLNKYCDKMYNVEYFLGNGRVSTFSGRLVNFDKTYLWFDNRFGINVVRQEDIKSLIALPDRESDRE